jgi:hypothetical protein
VRRTVALALVALAAGCGEAAPERPRSDAVVAGPQSVTLGWREPYPARARERLVYEVESLEVTTRGWSARIAVTNSTSVRFRTSPRSYGLMLFATGDLSELEDANREGSLPPPRPAEEIEPPPPAVLAPGATWRAQLSATGSLPAGSYVRVSFGPLVAEGEPPEDMEAVVRWITDRSYRLRP